MITKAILTLAVCAGVALVMFTASKNIERRAEYLEAEAAYFDCIESGLSRAECLAGVF